MTELPERIVEAVAQSGLAGQWVAPPGLADLSAIAGAYALVLRLDRQIRLDRPRDGSLAPGWYLYLGSAHGPGGLRGRLARHFRTEKRRHWHIDHLTTEAAVPAAFAVAGGQECDLAARLTGSAGLDFAVAGFGSSDCRRCASHLLAVPDELKEPGPPGE